MLKVHGGEVPRAQIGAQSLVREALKLRSADVWKNLAIVVGIPYLKRKLDESYDIHAAHFQVLGGAAGIENLPPDATIKQRFLHWYKWFLRKVYPSINAAFWFASLMFNLAYLFDGTKYSSPLTWLVGTRIRRMGPADYRAIDEAEEKAASKAALAGSRPGLQTSIFHPRTLGRVAMPALMTSLRMLLPASIFALKFLEWWHASDFSRQLARKATEGFELPPPTIRTLPSVNLGRSGDDEKGQLSEKSRSGDGDDNDRGDEEGTPSEPSREVISKSSGRFILTVPAPTPETGGNCPICGETIVNPTAAPTGYVYCYVCIHRWVEGEHDRQTTFMESPPPDGDDDVETDGGVSTDGLGGRDDIDASRAFSDLGRSWSGESVGCDNSDGLGDDSGIADESGGWNAALARPSGRYGKWESGKGRCAVTGMVILGGTGSLRRVIV